MITCLGQYQDAIYYLDILPSLSARFDHVPRHEYFRLVAILDQSQISDRDMLGLFIDNAIAAGARSVLCTGTAAELLHDCFDEVIVQRTDICHLDRGEFIVTTWHAEESLGEVLWKAYGLGFGCDAFEEDNPAILVSVLQDDPRIA